MNTKEYLATLERQSSFAPGEFSTLLPSQDFKYELNLALDAKEAYQAGEITKTQYAEAVTRWREVWKRDSLPRSG